MSHWRKEQHREKYFKQAKRDGYRARSAYKLLQIQERFKVIRRGDLVVDLGAAPGSWSQVAIALVGRRGRVVALDLQEIAPIPGVRTLQGDMTDLQVQDQLIAVARRPVDVVLSDAAPATTGVKLRDHVLSMELALAALAVAEEILHPGGNFVVKVYEGEDLPAVIHAVKMAFRRVKINKPDSSREGSWEQFIVARGYKGRGSSG
ncbi:MAG TPA: RlmE family RNA methyltransferase [Thermoflexia bacterium]|nr:RlmE family RNA methyltransferase [Thermoflexia bacterium]